MVTEQENFVVAQPYLPTKEEKQAIAELEAKGLTADDWDSGKKYIKRFKKNLRDDMYDKQNKRCAYCRIHVPIGCVPMQRDHIVYKNAHPQWTFLPENLCVSCFWCNDWKGTTETLVDPQTTVYPKVSEGFKIIHPLYDKYSEHIDLIGGILYHGRTDKGIFTIETCHLYRVELAEERADQKLYSENKGSIIAELVRLAALPEQYVDDKEEFLRYVTDVVRTYKEKQVNE